VFDCVLDWDTFFGKRFCGVLGHCDCVLCRRSCDLDRRGELLRYDGLGKYYGMELGGDGLRARLSLYLTACTKVEVMLRLI
jgi:hypothetical protein